MNKLRANRHGLLLFMYEVKKAAVIGKITNNAKIRRFINDSHEHDKIWMPVLV
jgi:hypothetical protein